MNTVNDANNALLINNNSKTKLVKNHSLQSSSSTLISAPLLSYGSLVGDCLQNDNSCNLLVSESIASIDCSIHGLNRSLISQKPEISMCPIHYSYQDVHGQASLIFEEIES